MSTELFDVPEVPEPRLTVARKRYEDRKRYEEATQAHKDAAAKTIGDPTQENVHAEEFAAGQVVVAFIELEAAERERLNR